MVRKHLFVSLLLLFSVCTAAQVLRRPLAGVYAGLSAYSALHTDILSLDGNLASLAKLKHASAAVYGERRFLLSELSQCRLVAGIPTRSGNFALKTNYAGFSEMNEMQTSLVCARKLGRLIDAGIQFSYYRLQVAGYGSASAVNAELGIIMHITDKLQGGIQLAVPAGGRYGIHKQEKIPVLNSFGLGYDVSEKVLISAEIQKEENQPVNVNAGILYKCMPRLQLRAGLSSATSSVWGGAGLILQNFRTDITCSYHPQLGITPGMALLFHFNSTAK